MDNHHNHQYSQIHNDMNTGIISWYERDPIYQKGPFLVYRAYLQETGEHILLLITSGEWVYHAHRDEDPRVVVRQATKALRAQSNYKKSFHWLHLIPMISFICTLHPMADRSTAIRAGNCTAGTDKWFKDHGYEDQEQVYWWQLLRHLSEPRSRMVAWYLWQEYLQV